MKTKSVSERGPGGFAAAALTLLSLIIWQATEARAQWSTSGT